MSDKAPATAEEVLPPKSKKGEKSPLEIIRDSQEIIANQLNLVKGELQRKLQGIAQDVLTLKQLNQTVDWQSPEFSQALNELGLMAPTKYLVTTSRTQPSTSYKQGTVKFKVLECLKDGKVKSIDNISAQTKLDKKKLGIPLGQMTKKDKTIKNVGRGEYKIAK